MGVCESGQDVRKTPALEPVKMTVKSVTLIDTTNKVETPAESDKAPVPAKEEKELTIETRTTEKEKEKDSE